MAHAEEMRRRLTPEAQIAILWIKDAHHRMDLFAGHRLGSVDVYAAVLDHGVRTPAEFAAYLAALRDRDTEG